MATLEPMTVSEFVTMVSSNGGVYESMHTHGVALAALKDYDKYPNLVAAWEAAYASPDPVNLRKVEEELSWAMLG